MPARAGNYLLAMEPARILIVDDEPSILTLASLILRNSGYPVLTSTNGQEGLEVFTVYRDTISIVVTDVKMPVMGGIDMAKAIKSLKRDVHVIFVSGYAPNEEITELILAWDAQFISKPFDLQQLRGAVQRAAPMY